MTGPVRLPVRGTAEEASGGAGERGQAPAPDAPGADHSPAPPLAHSADSRDAEVARIWRALGDVNDPEFPISIVDLGLVYGVRRSGDVVEVDLTFTATACPCMDFIRDDIRERLARESGVGEVRIREVWDPPWTPARISARGRERLRSGGVAA